MLSDEVFDLGSPGQEQTHSVLAGGHWPGRAAFPSCFKVSVGSSSRLQHCPGPLEFGVPNILLSNCRNIFETWQLPTFFPFYVLGPVVGTVGLL